MYYLDHDSGRLYEDATRARLVQTISIKYGDKFPLCLMVLDASGNAVDIGADVIRFGALLGGALALYIPGFEFSPLSSTAPAVGNNPPVTTRTPAYRAVLNTTTAALLAALASGRPVHLDAEVSRETYEGLHVTSQTICVHVERDLISTDNPPASAPAVDYATESYVRNSIAGVTVGTIPAWEIGSVDMAAADATPSAVLTYDQEAHKYSLALTIPVTPGADGLPGATPTLQAGNLVTTAPGTPASFTMEDMGGNKYKIHISLPLAKGDKGDKGDSALPPKISIGTVTTGAPAASMTADGVNSYKLNLVLAQGSKGDTGLTGPAPALAVGTVTTGAAGSNAAVSLAPNGAGSYLVNMTIPRGNTGTTGATGATGATGPAPALSVNSVYSGPDPSVTLIPNGAGSYYMNFVLPRGATGATGPGAEILKGNIYVLSAGSDPYFNVRPGTQSGQYYIDMGLPSGGGGAGTPAEAYILQPLAAGSGIKLQCKVFDDDDDWIMHHNGETRMIPVDHHQHVINMAGYSCRSTSDASGPSAQFDNYGIGMGREHPGICSKGHEHTCATWFLTSPDDTSLHYFPSGHHTHIVDGPDGKSYVTTGPSGEIWYTASTTYGGICLANHQHAVLIPS